MPKAFELRNKRKAKAAEAGKLVRDAIAENRANTPDEEARIKAIETELEGMDRQIATLERVEDIEGDEERSLGRQTSPLAPYEDDGPDLDGKHPYSLLRAYRCLLGIDRGGLEMEVSQHIASRSKRNPQGMYIPWNLANRKRFGRESRTVNAGVSGLGTGATGSGGGAVANILGTELIELLRNKMVTYRMGARVLNDMTGGTFSLPKQTGASTSYWVAEGTAPTGTNLTVGQVTWTPKTVGAFQDITRKFVLQANVDAEVLVREDLAKQIAIGMDAAGLNGSGAGQTPLGVMQDPDVPVVAIGTNGGDPTWSTVLGLEKLVGQANADFGKLGYVTSVAGRAKLKATAKIGTTFPVFIWENDRVREDDPTAPPEGMVNGYRAMASQQIPSNLAKGSGSNLTALIYGNWEAMTYAFWSGLDLLLDPYTGSSSGNIRIVALQDCDIQFRYENAFANCVDMNGG